MPTAYRAAKSLVTALMTAAFLQCVYLWPRLPGTMASNFDGSGIPNGWSSKTGFVVTYLLILGLIWLALLVLPERAIAKTQQLKMPHSEYWMAPERRQHTQGTIRAWLAWVAVLNLLLAIAVANLVFVANMESKPLNNSLFFASLVAYFVVLVGGFIALFRKFRLPGSGT